MRLVRRLWMDLAWAVALRFKGRASYCKTLHCSPIQHGIVPTRNIMSSGSLAWHECRKNGVCSGLSVKDYFEI